MSNRVSLKATHTRDAVRSLLAYHHPEQALHLLQKAVQQLRQARDWMVLRGIWEHPDQHGQTSFQLPSDLSDDPDWRLLIARILSGANDAQALADWTAHCETRRPLEPALTVIHAYALICQERHSEVMSSVQAALPTLPEEWRGLAYLRLMWSAQRLGQSWQAHLSEARQHLTGRALGIALLDASRCASFDNQDALAHTLIEEAIPLLKGDASHLAWAKMQMGLYHMRHCQPQAETWLRDALKDTLRPEGRPQRAQVLFALAAWQRTQGNWRVALEYYRRAEKQALVEDKTHVHYACRLGLARTARLSGHADEALQILNDALLDMPPNPSEFQVECSAAHLRLHDPVAARKALQQTPRLHGADLHLKAICEAELLRLGGQPALAAARLADLPPTRLAREEVRQFPELFALLSVAGKVIEPLVYPDVTRVTVQSSPTVKVWLNDRELPGFGHNQMTRALLSLLHSHPQALSVDELFNAVVNAERLTEVESFEKDLVYKVILKLRHALEYPESIQDARHEHYWLDPDTQWQKI